jgi:hypothetical protein
MYSKSIIEAKLILSNNSSNFKSEVSKCVLSNSFYNIFKTFRLLLERNKFHLERDQRRDQRREGFGALHKANKVKEKNFILIFFFFFKSINFWKKYNISGQ